MYQVIDIVFSCPSPLLAAHNHCSHVGFTRGHVVRRGIAVVAIGVDGHCVVGRTADRSRGTGLTVVAGNNKDILIFHGKCHIPGD